MTTNNWGVLQRWPVMSRPLQADGSTPGAGQNKTQSATPSVRNTTLDGQQSTLGPHFILLGGPGSKAGEAGWTVAMEAALVRGPSRLSSALRTRHYTNKDRRTLIYGLEAMSLLEGLSPSMDGVAKSQ